MIDPEVALAESMTFALDDAEVMRLRAAFEAVQGKPPKLLTPLPRRVRLRLWASSRVDRLAFRLIDRRWFTAAEWLWRACGMWSR